MNPLLSSTGAATPATTARTARQGARPAAFDRPRSEDKLRTRADAPEGSLISIVIPTYNEAENLPVLLERLAFALRKRQYELLVVDDDSADGTWRVAERLALADNRIRVIRRTEERGLSSAVLAGMRAAAGRTLVVIDGDLQHDEQKIPELVAAIEVDGVDVCLGSREVEGGSYGSFRRRRRLVSWIGAALARRLLRVPVTDPMSGFFAVSRDRFELVCDEVNPRGFKIMLEFLARGPRPQVSEVGYRFGERVNGSTKLTGSVVMDYLRALLGLFVHRAARRTGVAKRAASTGDAASPAGRSPR